ncbi:hypothetical protein IV203_029698 [Nitzschia inconspicua]|uniref:Uncharacterized protein n=1 Tax=Nitzschia inconspicua TaxID=303405 RepID=A0A9K3LR94_9STRA|nr:hypothetical protein IV203_029698 [Nitzschia inconspicua]
MPAVAENVCSYAVKGFVCLLGVIGIIISFFAARSCEFFSFVDTDGNPPDMAEAPPFNVALSANVGIFGYEITRIANGAGGNGGCVAYEDTFGRQNGYPSLATAQFCALLAPIFAGIAVFACSIDVCVCNFNGSFMTAALLFVTATALQAATFALLADPAFCLEDVDLECKTGPGTYMSIASTVLYAVCSLLMCCSPRSDPFCYNFGFRPESERVKRAPPPPQPQVIVQPVVIQTQVPMEEAPESPRKKKTTESNIGRKKKEKKLSNIV